MMQKILKRMILNSAEDTAAEPETAEKDTEDQQ